MSRKYSVSGRVPAQNTTPNQSSGSSKQSGGSRANNASTQGLPHSSPATTSMLSSVLAASYSVNVNAPEPELHTTRNPRKTSDRSPQPAQALPRRRPSYDQLARDTGYVSAPPSMKSRPPNLCVPPHRAGSGPAARKSSAASQDRDASGHLDLKRLLSKPAQHTTSSSSAVSLMSDSEVSLSSNLVLPYLTTETLPRSYTSKASTHSPSVPVSASSSRSPSSHRAGSGDASSSPGGAEKQLMQQQQQQHKTRNVLRRRPSSRSSPASPTVDATRFGSDDPNVSPRAATSKNRFRSIEALYPNHSPRPTTSPRDPSSSGVIRMKDHVRSAALTPAGAVAQAYKQQEQRREQLADMTDWDDHVRHLAGGAKSISRISELSKDRKHGLISKTKSVDLSLRGEDALGGAYYSVFGSPSGRLVAVGSPKDDSWDVDTSIAADAVHSSVSVLRPPGPEKGKSLSRKVSSRFKKVAESIHKDREVLPPHKEIQTHRAMSEGWRPYDGRSSVARERRSETLPRAMKAAGHSLDEYVDVEADARPGRAIPTVRNGSAADAYPEYPSQAAGSSAKVKKPAQEEPGGKWWKLMKRISTGALRDKYRDTTPPPPVPPLPANLQNSRTSLSGTIPSTSSNKTFVPPPPAPLQSPTTKNSNSSTGARPDTATRSSSPVSSELASSGFFNQAQSPRSSSSSYGEELRPPVADCSDSAVGQYIMPPDELIRLNRAQDKEKDAPAPRPRARPARPKDSAAQVERAYSTTSVAILQALPLPPPRRPNTTSHESNVSRESSPSPPIPSFTTVDPVNNFPLSDLSDFGVGSSGSPPARPPRSERRKPASIQVPLRSPTSQAPPPRSPSLSVRTPVTPRARFPSLVVDVLNSGRMPSGPSSGNSATKTTPSSASSSTPPSSVLSGSKKRSPATFRDLESPRAAWSEKEKADKWEDLLQRSARAGGTLHIGESGLLSEGLRLSDYSELSDHSDI